MSTEPMELAKNWDPKNAAKVLPGYAQIKYDGVPLTFKRPEDGGPIQALTRQNEDFSVTFPELCAFADMILLTPGASYTAECLVPGYNFKDSSGVIRRKTPDDETRAVIAIVFDYNVLALPRETYYIRRKQFEEVYYPMAKAYEIGGKKQRVHNVSSVKVDTVEDVDRVLEEFQGRIKHLEGMMVHQLVKPFQPGKRCWGMARVKPQPTIDLEVAGFEEAISEAGEGLGMVGRVNVVLRRVWPSPPPAAKTKADLVWVRTPVGIGMENVWQATVGVGPGKLSHAERTEIWDQAYPLDTGHRTTIGVKVYAQIKYMPDASYGALRQPTVQRLRTDKTEGDILEYS